MDETVARKKMAEAWVFMAKAETRLAEAGEATNNDITRSKLSDLHGSMIKKSMEIRRALESSPEGESYLGDAIEEIAEWDEVVMSNEE